eukprot:7737750-Heterocapsa_arctica.AAC.1
MARAGVVADLQFLGALSKSPVFLLTFWMGSTKSAAWSAPFPGPLARSVRSSQPVAAGHPWASPQDGRLPSQTRLSKPIMR